MAGKYDHINFRPPTSVANAAKRGLKMRSKQTKSNRGGTAVGLARANQLAKRETLSPATVKRMKAFFDRHQKNKKVDSGKKAGADKGQQAWLLWGGDAGRGWSAKKVRQMEAADKKKSVKRANNPCGMGKGGLFTKSNWCATGNPNQGKKSRLAKLKKQVGIKTTDLKNEVAKRAAKRETRRKIVKSRLNAIKQDEDFQSAKKTLKQKIKKQEDHRTYLTELLDKESRLEREIDNALKMDVYNVDDIYERRDDIAQKRNGFENITDEEQAKLIKEANEYAERFGELGNIIDEARLKRRELNSERTWAEQGVDATLARLIRTQMNRIPWEDTVFENEWSEYGALRSELAAINNYSKEMRTGLRDDVLLGSEGVDSRLAETVRAAIWNEVDEQRDLINDRLKELRKALDDGDQLRLPFDSGNRGQYLDRTMRRLWHEDRIAQAQKQSNELSQKIGMLPLFPKDRTPEQVEQALQLFEKQERLDQYKKEYEQFREENYGVSNQYFDEPTNAKVNLQNGWTLENQLDRQSPKENAKAAAEFFKTKGIDIDPNQLAILGGQGNDTETEIRINKDDETYAIKIDIKDGYKSERSLQVDFEGDVVMKNNWFKVYDTGKGLGTEIFARQVQALRAAGVKKIKCLAARSGEMNGYITWAKFGYDGDIPDEYLDGIEEEFGTRITQMSDLIQTAGGKEWWQEYGGDWYATFDLDPNSYSSRHFENYMKKRGIYVED